MALASRPATAEIRLLRSEATHSIAFTGRALVVFWKTETREQAVNELSSMIAGLAAECGPVGLLQVIDDHAIPPESATRAALARMLKNNETRIIASAVVFEGAGFRASVVRSIVIGISMLSRPQCPHMIFATANEGIAWLSARLSERRSSDHVASGMQLAVEQLRQRMRLASL